MQSLNKKTLVLLSAITLLLSGCSSLDEEDSVTKQQFQKNIELICTLTNSAYSNATLVKKSSGWTLHKNHYFKRGENLINVRNCYKEEKKNVWVF